MRFKAIEREYTDNSIIFNKKSIEIRGTKGLSVRYGDGGYINEFKFTGKIIRSRELPDELNTFFLYCFYNNGCVFRDGEIKLEPFLANINILPGEKFFHIDFDVTLFETIFTAEKVVDLFPSISRFELHELKLITYDRHKGELYMDMRGADITGSNVFPYNSETINLYIEYQKYKNKDKNIKTYNIDEM